jgi:hypothetical protein
LITLWNPSNWQVVHVEAGYMLNLGPLGSILFVWPGYMWPADFPHLQTQNIHLPTRAKILRIRSSIGGWKTLVLATAVVPISKYAICSVTFKSVIVEYSSSLQYEAILSCKLIFQSSKSNLPDYTYKHNGKRTHSRIAGLGFRI